MKKIVIVGLLSGILLVVSSIYVLTYLEYNNEKENNKTLAEKIDKITTDNKKENDNNITLNDELIKIKDKSKKEIKDYNSWTTLKEKLNSFLS